jgi:hypothetical protein
VEQAESKICLRVEAGKQRIPERGNAEAKSSKSERNGEGVSFFFAGDRLT